MHDLLHRYEAGQLSALEVETAIESHMSALEGIDSQIVHRSRHLSYRLVASETSQDERELFNCEDVSTVLADIRKFLDSLPTA
jgi:hypothetical protein